MIARWTVAGSKMVGLYDVERSRWRWGGWGWSWPWVPAGEA